jgi:glycosyltransferase involved in cell wall biosynthesis
MIIAIDGNEANTKEKVGVSTYAFEILWGLYKLNYKSKNPVNFVIYLKSDPNNDLPEENSFWKYRIIKGKKSWVLLKLMPSLFKTPRPNVFFTPTHYLPPFAPAPKVFTIHDLGYLDFSEQFRKYDFWQLKYWTAISVFVSKHIIAVSESTRKDIVRRYPFASEKVVVIHHGYDGSRFNNKISKDLVRRVRKKYDIPENYILFLSTLKPSKNIEGLIDGFNLIKDEFPGYKLVVAGKKGWFFEPIYKKVEELSLENRIVFTDYVQEDEKPALLAGAKVFALPSFWEGFGMDILNALSCGTPVVVSSVASIPEVAGNAGIYIHPDKPESIAWGLRKVLSLNDVSYNNLIKKGFKQAEGFSWEKSALKTLDLLKGIA